MMAGWQGRLLGVALMVGTLSGCASTSLFVPYPARAAAYKQAIATGNFQNSLADLDQRRGSEDKLLFLLERGRLEQLAGNADASMADYAQAMDAFRAIDQRAYVSASHTV